MAAYARYRLRDFLYADPDSVSGILHARYAKDGFVSLYAQQTKSWKQFIPLLQDELRHVAANARPDDWGILLEYPLYRLRKRIDAVILTGSTIVVLEVKVGESSFRAEDGRQVEDYALDLRDFHAGCRGQLLLPVLWCTNAPPQPSEGVSYVDDVAHVQRTGKGQLRSTLQSCGVSNSSPPLALEAWDAAPYEPVPTIIQAATTIFAEHDVAEITRADAENLSLAARRIVDIISETKANSRKSAIFLTGVPGAGKTLAGLKVVHDAAATGAQNRGDVIYLSGNTPLVEVLREALARDTVARCRMSSTPSTLAAERKSVRARIQHINDFLVAYLTDTDSPPHEHAIVFDEAQRAWDASQGAKKFEREKSEPGLLLEIMGRHSNWCACVCLVGGGQEINVGEEGIKGWGDSLRALPASEVCMWTVHGPEDVFRGGISTNGLSLGELPAGMVSLIEQDLRLSVPLRSYRSPAMSEWVAAVLKADLRSAKNAADLLVQYPVVLTRSLETAKAWLREHGRGERRYGLLCSSGARRLRADGLGEILEASDRAAIAQWYLNDRDDIRSSCVLEVPANEYACQGLEIDFSCVCWGGDFVASAASEWTYRRLSGKSWSVVRSPTEKTFIQNSYRVLLTRAREGLVIWVPTGDPNDATRRPEELDATANLLVEAGAKLLAST